MVTVTASGATLTEDNSSWDYLDFTISLSEVATETIVVPYQVINGSADDKDDIQVFQSGSVRFNAGESVKLVRLRADGDITPEADEAVVIELFSPTNADLAGGGLTQQAVAWIEDDDDFQNPTAVWVSSPRVTERGDIEYKIELSRPADEDLRIPWSLDGSATAGEDYRDASGTIRINRGNSEATVTVRIERDNVIESVEHLDLKLDLPSDITEVSGGQATIVDDDFVSDTYVLVEGNSIAEDDSSWDYIAYTISLTEPSTEVISVGWRIVGGTASSGSDHFATAAGTARFNPGDMVQTLRFRVDGDTEVEADESIILEITDPLNAALPGGVARMQTVAWIKDDDGGSDPKLSMFVSDPSIRENDDGSSTASFQVELSDAAPEDLSVRWKTTKGTARNGLDFEVSSGVLEIPKGASLASIGVPVYGDTNDEGEESFSLEFFLPDEIATVAGGTATIMASDPGGVNLLFGTDANEKIAGERRKDEIFGYGGDDTLIGRSGDDTLHGGDGDDNLRGAGGRDELRGNDGNDILRGNSGNDDLLGGNGADDMDGGGGKDRMVGGEGADLMRGRGGGDEINGGDGRDRIEGGGGGDELDGGAGRDTIDGGGKSDVIRGGTGDDTLTGGSKNDVFVFRRSDGSDTITDFQNGVDVIEIQNGANRFNQLDVRQDGRDTVISFEDTDITLLRVNARRIDEDDFIF